MFQVSIFLDGIADVRSFMAAIVHRHNLLTRKRYKNAAPSVALSDSIGIRNAAVINIGPCTCQNRNLSALSSLYRYVPKVSRVDSVFVFVISFLLHILNYFCFNTISIADNNVFSLIPFPLPTPSFSIFSMELFIEHTASFMLSALLIVFSIADCISSKRLSI